jgi:secreted Zn-dependent insulinase-like peptidase
VLFIAFLFSISPFFVYRDLVLSGDKLVFDIDLPPVASFLEFLKPSNSLALVIHKGLQGKTTLTERWYETAYNYRKFESDLIQKWEGCVDGASAGVESSAKLALPVANPFLPTDFSLADVHADWANVHEQSMRSGPVVIDLEVTSDDLPDDCYASESVAAGEVSLTIEGTTEEGDDCQNEEEEEEEGNPEDPGAGSLRPPIGTIRRTWFRQDSKWLVPKSNVSVKLQTLYAYSNPKDVGMTDMFANVLKEVLNEYSYYADCAGLYYDISNTNTGLELSVSGYHDKLPVLLSKIVAEMKHMGTGDSTTVPFTKEIYLRVKERVLRGYFNFVFSQPYNHCVTGSVVCMEDPRWTNPEKHRALASASYEDFVSFSANLIRSLSSEVLVHGNISPTAAKALAASITEELNCSTLSSELLPVRRAVCIEENVEYVYRMHCKQYNPKEKNSAVENTYFVCDVVGADCTDMVVEPTNTGTDTPLACHIHSSDVSSWSGLAINATLELLTHILSEPFFDQLRTKEQLGYLVHVSGSVVGGQVHLIFSSYNTIPKI